ncbi:endonuclease/exonuclease/phosphatase family protein [Streptomyces uncialis]|uniref:endonuclease/exonuclease/phosphatase family protein n=1 Tax=Streptomyces uncialis TaxID=1048205 RepID=UPI002E32BA07|nr:endonuclease/exonuclease/phosphatase family protein [Streptomyces uncialis]
MTTGTPPPAAPTDAPALPTNAPAASVPAVPGPPPAPGVPGTPPPGAPLPPAAGPLPPAEGPVPPAEGIGARGARRWSVRPWRGAWLAVAGALCAALLFAHPLLPNSLGNLGSLVETFLPWTVALLLPLTLFGLYRRAPLVLFGVVLVAVAWPVRFGGTLVDKRESGGELIVVSHNVGEDNPDPAGTARRLADTGAQVIAVQELAAEARETFHRALPARYAHHTVHGGVGLWSTYAMTGAQPVEIMPWPRALRATLATPKGPLTVFVAHLASVRVSPVHGFTTGRRDDAARLLARAVTAERPGRVLVVGDLNGTTDDRALAPLLRGLTSAQDVAGDGFGFSWPAGFPLARIDHVLARGIRPLSAGTLPGTGSDHLPVTASFTF